MIKKIFLLILILFLGTMIYKCVSGKSEVVFMEKEIINSVNENNYEKTKELLKKGHNVNSRDSKKRTLLMIAVYNNNYELSKLLIENNADINLQDDIQNNPFLYAGAEGYLDILKLLVEKGADTKITNRYGGVALIPAAEHGHVETVKYLLENTDIEVDHVNNLAWTALLEAIILGTGSEDHIKVVKLLLEHGADPNLADGKGVTPLKHAREKSYKEIEKLLIDAGAK